jgi:hypothetical protein
MVNASNNTASSMLPGRWRLINIFGVDLILKEYDLYHQREDKDCNKKNDDECVHVADIIPSYLQVFGRAALPGGCFTKRLPAFGMADPLTCGRS